jgi:molybdenum cofactor synthesis domain-containing protein
MITVGILTISDAASRGQRIDTSGENIAKAVSKLDAIVKARTVVPDEASQIAEVFKSWADVEHIDLILSTGGTGLAPRDVTPEATRQVIDREVPGLAEWMRAESAKLNVHAVLSRGVIGLRGKTLIVNLPGSPKGVQEMLELISPVLPHAIQIMKGIQDDHTPPASGEHARHEHHAGHRHDHSRRHD